MRRSILFLTLVSALPVGCSNAGSPPPAATASAPKQELTKDQLVELGRQHKTAAELYRALKDRAPSLLT